MKPVPIILIITASAFLCLGQANERAAYDDLSAKVVSAIRANDFGAAEVMATQLVELSKKVNGATSRDTAIATMNLAYSQKQQNKFDKAIQNFQGAIDILEKLGNLKNRELIDAYEGLAHTYFLNGKSKLAVQAYLTAVSSADKRFGSESKEGYSAALSIAMIYLKDKDYPAANDFFINSYGRALKHYGMSSAEAEKVEDSRACSALIENVSKNMNDAFYDVQKKYVSPEGVGILNGKAISLPRPEYPARAKYAGASGLVVIRVKVDETGLVFRAFPVCGNSLLRDTTTTAAYGARFSPTIVQGKPIAVSGVIRYNFSSK